MAIAVDVAALFGASADGGIYFNAQTVILAIAGAFVVSYVAMYGFDTFKELWERFKKGENINEQK